MHCGGQVAQSEPQLGPPNLPWPLLMAGPACNQPPPQLGVGPASQPPASLPFLALIGPHIFEGQPDPTQAQILALDL